MQNSRKMTAQQLRRIVLSVVAGIPELSYEEALTILGAPGTLAQGVAAAFEPFKKNKKGALKIGGVRKSYVVPVEYKGNQTVVYLLKQGTYDWENGDVTDEHFPQTKQGVERVRIELECFDRVIASEDVLRDFKRRGLRPANVAELLALGHVQPGLQRQFPIIALGQAWRFSRKDSFVVCLAWHGMLRRIYLLSRLKREWPAHCRFPAIRIHH